MSPWSSEKTAIFASTNRFFDNLVTVIWQTQTAIRRHSYHGCCLAERLMEKKEFKQLGRLIVQRPPSIS